MRNLILSAVLTVTPAAVFAQPAPAAAPAAPTPTTAPARQRVAMPPPPGFEKVTVGTHTAYCLPTEAAWVKQGLTDLKPATRPTTMPADLVKRATDARPDLLKQMAADLAMTEKEASAVLDEHLLPTLKKLEAMSPPVFFLVITEEKLNEICRDGWGAPRYHYNRVAEKASYDMNVMLSLDQPMDDSVLPAFYKAADAPDVRAKNFAAAVQQLDARLTGMIAQQANPIVFNTLAQHVGMTVFDPLKLGRDQLWLAQGATGYFAAKYAATVTGLPRDAWLQEVSFDDPRFPVGGRSIDLAKPLAETAMKAAAVPYYNQALRRKAIRAVIAWSKDPKGGDASIGKVVAAVRAKPPADGAELLKIVREVGGVDLTKELAGN